MNGTEIANLFSKIAGTSARSAKESLLSEHKDDETLKKVLQYTYDPFKTYGVAVLNDKEWNTGDVTELDASVWELLDKLISREYSGNAAHDAIRGLCETLTPTTGGLVKQIILKDLKIGIGAATINKIFPNLIPTFDCMLAHKFDLKRVKRWPWIVEPKLDGFRVLAFVDFNKNSVQFFSRAGKEYTCFDHMKEIVVKTFAAETRRGGFDDAIFSGGRVVFDGEMVSGSFAETSSALRKKMDQADDAIFNVFDAVNMNVFDGKEGAEKECGTYLDRREVLEQYVSSKPSTSVIRLTPKYYVNGLEEVKRYYMSFRDRGLEGAVVKDPKALYQRKRSFSWLKMKNEETVDCPIVEAYEGEGKYEGQLGGFIVNYLGKHVRVGGGFSDEMRKTAWSAYLADKAKISAGFDAEMEVIGRMIEVEYHEITPDGSLRHPRFVRFRDDKTAEMEETEE